MSVMRLGGILQPAWARTSSVVAGTIQPAVDQTAEVSQRAAKAAQRAFMASQGAADLAIALLLAPTAFLALVFGVWRLGEDMGWTEAFFISNGLFSHWQVWIAISIGLAVTGKKLRGRA
jgi:hypothetical protein